MKNYVADMAIKLDNGYLISKGEKVVISHYHQRSDVIEYLTESQSLQAMPFDRFFDVFRNEDF